MDVTRRGSLCTRNTVKLLAVGEVVRCGVGVPDPDAGEVPILSKCTRYLRTVMERLVLRTLSVDVWELRIRVQCNE